MDVSGCEEMALSVMATGADRAIQAELKVAYGSSKMVKEIRGRGFPAGKERVERLMRPICKPSLSGATEGIRHGLLDEPQGQLLGQRCGRELLQ